MDADMPDVILSEMESRVLYLIIEESGSSVAQLANKIGRPARDIEDALMGLIEKELVAASAEGVYTATASGVGRWNEVVYLGTS